MKRLTARELSRETAAVLDRVERGASVEVTRGGRVVARLVPADAGESTADWSEHFRWLEAVERRIGKPALDPVDQLLADRRRRDF